MAIGALGESVAVLRSALLTIHDTLQVLAEFKIPSAASSLPLLPPPSLLLDSLPL
jgi:hypothetical protein